MLELEINKKQSLLVPSEFKEVPVSLGIQLINYSQKENITENDKIVILSTLSGLEPEVFLKMLPETIDNIYDSLHFLKKEEQQIEFYKTFKLNKVHYGMVDFDNLTVHEYSDLQFYLDNGDFPTDNIDKLMCILFRPIIKKKHSLKNILKNIILTLKHRNFIPKIYDSYEISEYSEKDLNRSELFGHKLTMGFALAAFSIMIQYREDLLKQFSFKQEVPEEDKDQYDDPSITKEPSKSFEQIWGLYHIIATLSNSLDEREKWLKKPIKEFLNYLAYNNQKIQMENERAKANQINS